MSDSVSLISSSEINQEDLISFLQPLGAFIIEDISNPYTARISKVDLHVWIGLYSGGFNDFDEDDMAVFEQMLSRKPKTNISLEISSYLAYQQIAIELICAFAERWPCILDNSRGKIFSSQELFDLRSSGGDLR